MACPRTHLTLRVAKQSDQLCNKLSILRNTQWRKVKQVQQAPDAIIGQTTELCQLSKQKPKIFAQSRGEREGLAKQKKSLSQLCKCAPQEVVCTLSPGGVNGSFQPRSVNIFEGYFCHGRAVKPEGVENVETHL